MRRCRGGEWPGHALSVLGRDPASNMTSSDLELPEVFVPGQQPSPERNCLGGLQLEK